MRPGLTARLSLATGVLALVVTAMFGVLLYAMTDTSRARDVAVHSVEESSMARDVRGMLIDMETGQRGFVLTGEQSFLEPWEVGRRMLPGKLAALRNSAVDLGLATRAERLESDVLAYIRDYSVPLVNAARRGEGWVRSLATSQDGKRRMDTLRQELDTFVASAEMLNVTEQTNADRGYRRATVVAGGGLGVSVLVSGLSAAYLAQGVVRPVRRTARMAERLAAGDLETRVPETGKAEIGVLERNFNSMAESLQRSHDALARLSDEHNALRRVATLVAQGRPPNEVFAAVTGEVGLLLRADITRLLRFETDGSGTVAAAWTPTGASVPVGARIDIDMTVAALVRQSGKPARRTEQSPPELPAGFYSAVGTPIMVGGAPWGAMTALSPLERPLSKSTETRMAEFTDLVGTAIANAQARADLMASRARIVAAGDESRRRIERDLHDGIQQRLVALALMLRTVEPNMPPETPELRDHLAALDAGLAEAVEELREVSRGIHPAILSEGGLAPALRTLCRRSAVPTASDVRIENRLPPTVEAAAYYVVAEALTNAAKHANASVVKLNAGVEDGHLFVTVGDDGTGGADPSRGSGLIGLIDRVEALGGTITVASQKGQGTTLHVELPLGSQKD